MVITGYLLAFFMGLILGLIGAGGSILTLPILVYFLQVQPIVATAYSLLIVGMTAFIGMLTYWKRKAVYFRQAFLFAVPTMLWVLLTRVVIVPAIPLEIGGIEKNWFIMIFFATLMLFAARRMLMPSVTEDIPKYSSKQQLTRLTFGSAFVGVLTGLVGAGGGFLIIPSLIAIFGLTMKQAVATSLMVISINSFVGFAGDFAIGFLVDWSMVGIFMAMTSVGVITGSQLTTIINGHHLKKLFGVFLIMLSSIILFKESGMVGFSV